MGNVVLEAHIWGLINNSDNYDSYPTETFYIHILPTLKYSLIESSWALKPYHYLK
jgi:hypothetical protein